MSEEAKQSLEYRFSIAGFYKRQIIVKSVQFLGLLYVVYGIFVAFASVCISLDKKAVENNQLFRFWDPVATIYSIANVLVFAMTVYYKYWNYHRGLSRLISLPVDHMIVCFILVPLFFFSAVYLIIEIVRDIVIIPCEGYFSFLIPLSSLLLFIGAAILIFDVSQNIPVSGDWKMNLLKTNVIFFTVIGIANCFIISFSYQHMLIFRKESQNSSYGDKFQPNYTCINSMNIRMSVDRIYNTCDKYLRSTVLLFCVCTFAYLIQPMIQRQSSANDVDLHSISQETLISNSETSSISDEVVSTNLPKEIIELKVNSDQTPSFRLPSAALVLCIIFLSLSFLSFIIMLSLYEKDKLKVIGSLIFTTFPIVVYILGSGLSIVHINEVGRWPICLDRHGKVIEKCLIWIGAAGQLSISMATIACSIDVLTNYNFRTNETYPIIHTANNVLLIPNNLLIVLQTFLQTVLISLAIDRKWIRPEINSWAELLCPAVGMMGLNIGLLLLSISEMNFPSPIIKPNSSLFLELFLNGLKSIGGTLSTLQRLHASILFASMIVYTHN